jgi:hypothetical protein
LKTAGCPGKKVIYWGKEEKRDRLKLRFPAAAGKRDCLFRATCSKYQYGRTFYLNPIRIIGWLKGGYSNPAIAGIK